MFPGGYEYLVRRALDYLPGKVAGRAERQVDPVSFIPVKSLTDFSHCMSQVGRHRNVQRLRAGLLNR